nr:PIN domain-containing protein [Planktothrix sp. FACHB-1365]
MNFQDFEDAVQCACGIANEVDAIITRDISGFVNAGILVIAPGELKNLTGQ